MRLLKKIVCRPYNTYSIEFFDTETRQYNHEIWTVSPAVPTAETDFCEYLREHYTIFSDSQGELQEGGTRLSPQFDAWCAARALSTRQVYGWVTFQQAIDHYRQRFVTPRTLNFSELYGNQSRITYLDEVGFHTHNAGYRPTKHHHFCDTCQKTRKCVLCEGKPKVRKLCENCDIAETIRRLHNVTVATPNAPSSGTYRVNLDQRTGQVSWDSEVTNWTSSGLEFVHGASNNSGSNTPQT
jgi:hypothetical protein